MSFLPALVIIPLGLLCIVLGYRLFCELPVLSGSCRGHGRVSAFFLNLLPGALLAVFGVGLLAAQTQALMGRHPLPHRGPAVHDTGWPREAVPARSRFARAA